jgi:hypothetical protein
MGFCHCHMDVFRCQMDVFCPQRDVSHHNGRIRASPSTGSLLGSWAAISVGASERDAHPFPFSHFFYHTGSVTGHETPGNSNTLEKEWHVDFAWILSALDDSSLFAVRTPARVDFALPVFLARVSQDLCHAT